MPKYTQSTDIFAWLRGRRKKNNEREQRAYKHHRHTYNNKKLPSIKSNAMAITAHHHHHHPHRWCRRRRRRRSSPITNSTYTPAARNEIHVAIHIQYYRENIRLLPVFGRDLLVFFLSSLLLCLPAHSLSSHTLCFQHCTF